MAASTCWYQVFLKVIQMVRLGSHSRRIMRSSMLASPRVKAWLWSSRSSRARWSSSTLWIVVQHLRRTVIQRLLRTWPLKSVARKWFHVYKGSKLNFKLLLFLKINIFSITKKALHTKNFFCFYLLYFTMKTNTTIRTSIL